MPCSPPARSRTWCRPTSPGTPWRSVSSPGAPPRSAGCSAAESAAVRRAGYLHDLGRIGVPFAVWQRPGKVDADGWEKIRLHAYHTERLLSRSPFLAALGSVAGCHHERLDGSGYHRRTARGRAGHARPPPRGSGRLPHQDRASAAPSGPRSRSGRRRSSGRKRPPGASTPTASPPSSKRQGTARASSNDPEGSPLASARP